MRIHKLSLILTLLLLALANIAFAQAGKSQPVVTSKVLLSVDKLRPGDTFTVAVKGTIRKGYHIYTNKEKESIPTTLTLKASQGITFDKPVYPKGHLISGPGGSGKISVYEGTFVIKVKGHVSSKAKLGQVTITSNLDYQACKNEQCMMPDTATSKATTSIVKAGSKVAPINKELFAVVMTSSPKGGDAVAAMVARIEHANPIVRFVILFVAGLALAFTPCVYPMIPVTVGYFSGQSEAKTKKVLLLAAMYVLGLALTYSTLGVIAATTGKAFGDAMQSPFVTAGIAVVLFALALSMFGLFEIRPPSFIESRASGKSGVLGALIMGLIFGIVVAPCVGPLVLALLIVVARIGSPIMGFLLFFALALGLGTPLFFLAAFSAKLPAPGMWMVTVKKVAGFILLGAAAYFISLLSFIPDQVDKFLLPVVLLATGVYLAFFDRAIKTIKCGPVFGKAFGIAAVVIAVMMSMPKSEKLALDWKPYTVARITQAAEDGKPVMLDFTAKWCGACKELEHGPFSDAKVIRVADGFTMLRVDGTNRNNKTALAAVEKYRITGFPTIVYFDASGNEVNRTVGFEDSKVIIKRIKSAK